MDITAYAKQQKQLRKDFLLRLYEAKALKQKPLMLSDLLQCVEAEKDIAFHALEYLMEVEQLRFAGTNNGSGGCAKARRNSLHLNHKKPVEITPAGMAVVEDVYLA